MLYLVRLRRNLDWVPEPPTVLQLQVQVQLVRAAVVGLGAADSWLQLAHLISLHLSLLNGPPATWIDGTSHQGRCRCIWGFLQVLASEVEPSIQRYCVRALA